MERAALQRANASTDTLTFAKSEYATARDAFKDSKRRAGFNLSGNIDLEVIVAGTRVRIQEEGFDRTKYFDVESLQHDYYPLYDTVDRDEHAKKVLAARILFSRVFPKKAGDYLPDDVPCVIGNDKDLLLEGLNNRYDMLLVSVINFYERTHKDTNSARLRQMVEHTERLKTMIEAIQENRDCDTSRYNDKGYRINLTADQIEELLRQFSFLLLQGMNANQNYQQFESSVSPQELIELLQENPIDEDSMDRYIKEYYGVPPILGEILEATETQSGVFEKMVHRDLDEVYMSIMDLIKVIYPDEESWDNEKSKIEKSGYRDPRLKIRDGIQLIVQKWKGSQEALQIYETEKETVTKSTETLQAAMKDLGVSKGKYEKELADMQEILQGLMERIGAQDVTLSTIVSANEMKKSVQKVVDYIELLDTQLAGQKEEEEGLRKELERMEEVVRTEKEKGLKAQQALNSAAAVVQTAAPPTVVETPPAVVVATAPEATAPEAKAPEAKAPEAKAPEAKAPEAKVPEATAPEATGAQKGGDPTLDRIRELATRFQQGGGPPDEPQTQVNPLFMTLLTRVRAAAPELHPEDATTLKVSNELCDFSKLLTLVREPIQPLFPELLTLTKQLQPDGSEGAAFSHMNQLFQLFSSESGETTIAQTELLGKIQSFDSATKEKLAEQLTPLVSSTLPNLAAPAANGISPALLFGLLIAAIQQYLLTIRANTLEEYHCPIPPELLLGA